MKKKRSIYSWIVTCILALGVFICWFPLLMALMNSFKTNRELFTNIITLPSSLKMDNYIRTWEKMHYLRSFCNTAFLAVLAVILIVVFAAMAGWKLCRVKTRLSSFLFALFVFSMLIPFSSIMIPLYRMILTLGIKNSLAGLAFVYAGMSVSMTIFLYHGFVKSVPYELEEAALIDGCGDIKRFVLIVFPLLRPITFTIIITNVLWIWNDFLLPLIVIGRQQQYTLLLSTNTLFGQYSSDWTAILAALILSALPMILFYSIFQKNIIKGIADGALKG